MPVDPSVCWGGRGVWGGVCHTGASTVTAIMLGHSTCRKYPPARHLNLSVHTDAGPSELQVGSPGRPGPMIHRRPSLNRPELLSTVQTGFLIARPGLIAQTSPSGAPRLGERRRRARDRARGPSQRSSSRHCATCQPECALRPPLWFPYIRVAVVCEPTHHRSTAIPANISG